MIELTAIFKDINISIYVTPDVITTDGYYIMSVRRIILESFL